LVTDGSETSLVLTLACDGSWGADGASHLSAWGGGSAAGFIAVSGLDAASALGTTSVTGSGAGAFGAAGRCAESSL